MSDKETIVLLKGWLMTEEELQQRRKEFRDSEIQKSIEKLSSAEEYRQTTLKINYTRKVVKKSFGKIGWALVITQASGLIFFSTLFVLSYIPKTKFLVTKILP